MRSTASRAVHGGGEEEAFPWKARGAVGQGMKNWIFLLMWVRGISQGSPPDQAPPSAFLTVLGHSAGSYPRWNLNKVEKSTGQKGEAFSDLYLQQGTTQIHQSSALCHGGEFQHDRKGHWGFTLPKAPSGEGNQEKFMLRKNSSVPPSFEEWRAGTALLWGKEMISPKR